MADVLQDRQGLIDGVREAFDGYAPGAPLEPGVGSLGEEAGARGGGVKRQSATSARITSTMASSQAIESASGRAAPPPCAPPSSARPRAYRAAARWFSC